MANEEILQETAASTEEETGLKAGETEDENTVESAETDENEGDHEPEEKPKKEGGFQKRIRKLTTRVYNTEAERDYWREQALARNQQKVEPAAKEPEAKEPNPDDFNTVAEYIAAVRKFDREQLQKSFESKLEEKLGQRDKATAEKSVKQTREQKWQSNLTKAREAIADFDEVMEESGIQVTREMADVIMDSELGAEMAYHLGKHPDEAATIARMSPLQAAAALGKIEAKIASQKQAAEEKAKEKDEESEEEEPPKPVSKAPAPPQPVRKTAPVSVDLNDPSVPFKTWVKERERRSKG